MRASKKAPYIKPENVHIGDMIQVTRTEQDVKVSVTGTVMRRERDHGFTNYLTADGYELVSYHPAHKPPYTIRRILAADNGQRPLEGIEL